MRNSNIPKGWKKVKLGEVVSSNKNNITKDYPYSNILYLDTGSITRGKIESLQRYKLENAPSRAKRLVKENDIVYSTVRPIQRHYGFITNPPRNLVVSTGFVVIETNQEKVDSKFIYYFLTSDDIVEILDVIAEGSTSAYPSLRPSDIENLEILLPPLPEQKAIASVLSSLDDKIDLLHRQNKTLEQMSETLFRQWFIEEAEEGWEEVSLGNSNLAKIIKSGIDKFEGEKIYLATGDVNDTEIIGGNKIKYNQRPSRANMQQVKFSVWFAKKGGVRKLLMFDDYSDIDNIILSTGFTGLKTTELSHYYIWCYILTQEFQEIKDSFVSGSVQPDINNDGVLQIIIPNPDKNILVKFNNIVKPLFIKIQFNTNQICVLEQLRDTLLPKLMSGEVRVKY